MWRFRFPALFLALAMVPGLLQGARAAELGFNIFPLGGLNFGAGVTPPPGLYVSPFVGYYEGTVGGNVAFGRDIAVDLRAKLFQSGTNFLYVPENAKLFDGQLGFSVTLQGGHMDLAGNVSSGGVSVRREVSAWGFGDLMLRGQIGWTHGHFSHTFYVTGWLPTGLYAPGFAPNIGLNRPAADLTWGFTYLEPTIMVEFSGAVGVTFNARNDATDYLTGIESHFEWGIGKKLNQQLTVGVVGYQYLQLTGDSGSGAVLGPFKSRNNGIGPGVTYATQIAGHVVVVNLRQFFEYESVRHFGGMLSTASVTVRY